jgi:2-polyprenyl-3-methyl-5-hydroxy-6-metoxy-1,4-benzoquinol methylase
MKETYLKYYQAPSQLAPFRFLADSLFTRQSARKLSLLNRQKDYVQLLGDRRLLPVHRELNEALLRAVTEWDSYDYGEGYFYQSLDLAGIRGLRDTRARVEAMDLMERLRGRTVLDIGCNSGFLALSLAPAVERITGFDVNPHLISVARTLARHLDATNAEFHATAFEDYARAEPVDAVLSFANHSTFDGNTRQSVSSYLDRCSRVLKPRGLFLFESHHPAYEKLSMDELCAILEQDFDIQERRVLQYGTHYDRGRTFIVAQRKAE